MNPLALDDLAALQLVSLADPALTSGMDPLTFGRPFGFPFFPRRFPFRFPFLFPFLFPFRFPFFPRRFPFRRFGSPFSGLGFSDFDDEDIF